MPFSLGSYLSGVGTIAGALAVGVGSGALMTKTAMKDTAPPTRIERMARTEPAEAAAPQPTATKENPASPVDAMAAVQADPAASAQSQTSKPDSRIEAGEKPTVLAKPVDPASVPEQKEAAQDKPPERRVERPKHYAERRARRVRVTATRQWQPDEQRPPQPGDYVIGHDEPGSGLFRIIRPAPPDDE